MSSEDQELGLNGRYECSECGSRNQNDTSFFGTTMRCEDCGNEYSYSERTSTAFRGEGWEKQDVEVRETAEKAEGDTVTRKILLNKASNGGNDNRTLYAYLDEGEQPHHILLGTTIDIEGGGDSTSLYGNDRSRKIRSAGKVKTVLTDKRIFVLIPQMLGDDQRNVPYHSITGVDLDIGLIHKRLTVQTHGRTYHLSGTKSSKEDCEAAVDFIRRKLGSRTNDSESDDPLDRLDKLSSLHERGIVSDEEFEMKKQRLLDEV